jgi:hypothetical protein
LQSFRRDSELYRRVGLKLFSQRFGYSLVLSALFAVDTLVLTLIFVEFFAILLLIFFAVVSLAISTPRVTV